MLDQSNDYQLPSWPPTKITREIWNSVLGDIGLRLRNRETLEASFELLQQEGIQAALDYIQVSIAPQLSDLQRTIQESKEQIDDLLQGNAPNAHRLGGQLPAFYAKASDVLSLLQVVEDKADADDVTALIQQRIAALVDSSPATLDTLKELAAALGNDANFSVTVTNALADLEIKIKQAGAPIGTTIMMQGNGNTPPPGYLLHNGAPCTSAYPQLRAWLLANGAAVNGNGDPIIEDMGGYFPRGWRSGQVVDSGRVFGSMQQDAFQNHRHPANRVSNATVSVPVNNNQQGPCPYIADGYVNVPMAQANGHGATLPDGDSGAPRTAAETRPVNKTFTYWIKAYAADQVPGSVDFAALANNLQALQTAVNSKGTKRQASITPSGNAFTLNGLPAGVQRVLIKLSGIQIASNGQIVVRLGTSGGVETSAGRYFSKSVGFAATSLQESSLTTGFLLNDASVGSAITLANYGVIELQRHAPGSNSWELSGTMTRGNSGQNIFVGGATLLDELTQIQFTTTAGNIAFSGNSSVAIEWEF